MTVEVSEFQFRELVRLEMEEDGQNPYSSMAEGTCRMYERRVRKKIAKKNLDQAYQGVFGEEDR